MNKIISILFLFISTNIYSERVYFYINSREVRLRENPSLESKILTILKQNETVDFKGIKSDQKMEIKIRNKNVLDYFYNVETNQGLKGWIFGYYITDSKTFETNNDHCSRSIPTETVLGIKKEALFNKRNLEYTENFQIEETKYTIINGGCDYFSHVIRIEEKINHQKLDSKIIIKEISEKLSLIKKYYQNDFDLNLVINHLKNKNILFGISYEFISGKKIKFEEDVDPGPSFLIKKPKLKDGKLSVEIVLASGLL